MNRHGLLHRIIPIATAAFALTGACLCGDDWPQWRGPHRDGRWPESGIVEKFSGPRLEPLWRAAISSGYSGPTVAGGRVLVTDRVATPGEIERVLAFDANTGQRLWSFEYPCPYAGVSYDAGPRASVSLDEGRAYALGTMGHLHCLDAATGKLLWSKTPGKDYAVQVPIWGIAASPLVHGDLLFVQIGAAEGACVVALDKRTGAERWRALDDRPSYSAPILIEYGDRTILVCWTGDHLAGLDPASGRIHWRYPFAPSRMVINVAAPVFDGGRLFLSAFYDGAAMLRLSPDGTAIEEMWRRKGPNEKQTDALHAMIATPILEDDSIYGVDSYGQLRCLDANTGDRIWEDLTAVPAARWANIHMVRNGARVWMFNERGDLIIAEMSPKGFHEIGRTHLIDPTTEQLRQRGGVCWSHPAFANRRVFARNDKELVCADLSSRP